jgi:hypothetical protein
LSYTQYIPRELLESLGDGPPVHGLEGERFQDEEVEGAAYDVVGVGHVSRSGRSGEGRDVKELDSRNVWYCRNSTILSNGLEAVYCRISIQALLE